MRSRPKKYSLKRSEPPRETDPERPTFGIRPATRPDGLFLVTNKSQNHLSLATFLNSGSIL